MNTKHKQNRLIIIILLIACCAVWGVIAHQILWAGSIGAPASRNRQEPHISIIASGEKAMDSTLTARISLLKDPFRPWYPRQKKVDQKPPPTAQNTAEPLPPTVRFIGFLGSEGHQLAVLENETGQSAIAQAGDSLFDIQILEIHREHLLISFQGRDYELPLEAIGRYDH